MTDENIRPDGSQFGLVVVGASAGGIEALSTLVSGLPADFAVPIVIAQHLNPSRQSHLEEILARKSALSVRTVTKHEPLRPGVVYVVPANRHVSITDSEINLRTTSARQSKPSVDLLLSSAAEAFGEGLIAVILTGTGKDGAAGAAEVAKAGGTVIIQNPETAEYPGMPLSLAPSTVDIVAELDGIGQVLQDLSSRASPSRRRRRGTGRWSRYSKRSGITTAWTSRATRCPPSCAGCSVASRLLAPET